jgi:SAM-dependent methyltransferase
MTEPRIIPPDEARATWAARWAEHDRPADRPPSAWVLGACAALPQGARVADVAGGDGRHALPLAARGCEVVLVDFTERAVRLGVTAARDRRGTMDGIVHGIVHGVVADALALPLRAGAFDAIVIVNFLERALFSHLPSLLRPGGRLIVETFTTDHLRLVAAGRAHGPRNPAYLLAPGELPRLAAPLIVDEYAEVEAMDGPGQRAVARIVAIKRN